MSTTSLSSTASTPPPPPPPASGGGGSTGGAPGSATGPGGTSPSPQRSLVALLAAATLVVVVIALVLVFGIARPPALPTLAEEPEPSLTASLAWTQWDGDGGGSCVHVLTPSGEERQVGCFFDGEELVAWTDDGIAMAVWGPRHAVELIDPDTGEVVDRIDGEPEEYVGRGGDAVRSRTVDGTLTVTLREGDVELWRVDVPDTYGVNDGFLSPDGEWVVLVDRAGRLLLVPADGSREPRVWHEVEESWVRPVWEGTPLPGPIVER